MGAALGIFLRIEQSEKFPDLIIILNIRCDKSKVDKQKVISKKYQI